ncbi:matrixin family metalloprotease [Kocuria sp. CPCC 205258]|uniref:matrixin family metalloprotease n=1 Tax=Kocuria sp. CPCC 205258 TaxID=3073552 RepID=UPI0034D4A536
MANLATKASALCDWCPAVLSCLAADKGPSPKVTDGRFLSIEELGVYDEEVLAARAEEDAPDTHEVHVGPGVAASIIRQAPDGQRVIVSGHVMLDTPDLLQVAMRPQGLSQVKATIMHEIAHVAGLTHVEDPSQLMHATSTEATEFAAGDRAGLAKLGAGECHPEL